MKICALAQISSSLMVSSHRCPPLLILELVYFLANLQSFPLHQRLSWRIGQNVELFDQNFNILGALNSIRSRSFSRIEPITSTEAGQIETATNFVQNREPKSAKAHPRKNKTVELALFGVALALFQKKTLATLSEC